MGSVLSVWHNFFSNWSHGIVVDGLRASKTDRHTMHDLTRKISISLNFSIHVSSLVQIKKFEHRTKNVDKNGCITISEENSHYSCPQTSFPESNHIYYYYYY